MSIVSITSAVACDICGCFMGITPYDNQSSIAVLYRYRSFNGYEGQIHHSFPSGSGFLPQAQQVDKPITSHNGDPSDFEVYRSLELRARYFVSRRVELNAILPYVSNSEQYNGNKNTLSGIGDANIYTGYHFIRKIEPGKNSHRLIGGAGLKLPSGNDSQLNTQGYRFNALTQTGTGSTDVFIYANYLLGVGRSGLSLSTTYKMNGRNSRQEGVGNSTTSFLNLFHNVSLGKKVQLVPSMQAAYEYSAGEKYLGKLTGEHRMNNLMAGAGADIFFNNLTLNLAFQRNAWAAKDDHARPAARVVMGLTYNFNQLYYLLN